MSGSDPLSVAALLRMAVDVYDDDREARTLLEAYIERLESPMRVAIAGMVKAGKSTLLNAIIGEQIAPTDTSECTRVVTWYRHGEVPRVTLIPLEGTPTDLPVKRVDGRLMLDLGGYDVERVKRLIVDWPSPALRQLTLIDTPGIESLSPDVSVRTLSFLTPEDAPSEADAIVYLMRHIHAADLRFLEAFGDATAGRSGVVNALAVLARADEVGAGRIDALISARAIADRYRRDERLRSLALDVRPVAGLLAQSARSLREADFRALTRFSALDHAERARQLVSAERFLRTAEADDAEHRVRADLLDRFGMFGIRLATALLRGGIADSTALAHELTRRSGLEDLQRVLTSQFRERAAVLKDRSALVALEMLIAERPRPGVQGLLASIERFQAGAHDVRELAVLARSRSVGLPLEPELRAEAERIVGGHGVDATDRLGLPASASRAEIRSEAFEQLSRWRAVASHPLAERTVVDVCEVVIRSCEALVTQTEVEPQTVL